MAKTPRQKIVTKKHLARVEREQLQRKYILIATGVVLALVSLVILYGILDFSVFQYNRPVAKVNDQTITLREFQTRVKFDRVQLINQYQQTAQMAQIFGSDPNNSSYFTQQLQQIQTQLDSADALGQQAVDELVEAAVIEQQAKQMGITVSDEEVEAKLQEAFGFYANGTPTPEPTATVWETPTLNPTELSIVTITPTPTEAPTATQAPTETPSGPTATATTEPTLEPTPAGTATPRPTSTPYTLEGYQNELKIYAEQMSQYGLTENDLRDIFRSDLLRTKVMEKVTADVQPEQEMVWARHILVPDESAALAAIERIKNGEDFGEVAKEISTDDSNKEQGGDLGWFPRGQMVAEFEKAAFDLPVGQISQPVKTDFGYHVIQVIAHEVRPLSADELSAAKQTEFNTWLSNLTSDEKTVQKLDTWQGKVPTEPALSATGG